MKKNIVTDKEYAIEAEKHSEFVNYIFGITVFGLSLTCLQFKEPWRIGVLCLIIVVPLYIVTFVRFPSSLQALRSLAREFPNDNQLKGTLRTLESRFHGWKATPRYAIFWVSLTLYVFIVGSSTFPQLQLFIRWLQG